MKINVITTVFALSGLLSVSGAFAAEPLVDGLKESPNGRASGHGLTGSIGYSAGASSTLPKQGKSETSGVAGGSFALGVFVTNNTTLALRASSLGEITTAKYGRSALTFAPYVEHWFSQRLFCGAGAGLALDIQRTGKDSANVTSGIAVPLALGVSAINLERASFRVSLQATPSFYKDYKDISVGVVGDLVIF